MTTPDPVKRYRLSYKNGVMSFDDSAMRPADASEPMVLASTYDAAIAERDALKDEVYRRTKDAQSMAVSWAKDVTEKAALAARVERLERDAARYQWIRSEEVATEPRYYPFWKKANAKL